MPDARVVSAAELYDGKKAVDVNRYCRNNCPAVVSLLLLMQCKGTCIDRMKTGE